MTKLNVLSKVTLFISLFSLSLSSMASQTSFGIEEQLLPDLRQNKRPSIDRKEVNILPLENIQSQSSSYLSSLGHIASSALDGLTKAVLKGYGVYTVVALPIVTALETNSRENASSTAIMSMSEIDLLTKENCLTHFYDSKRCDQLLGRPKSQYSSIAARYAFLPQISYVEIEATTQNNLVAERKGKKKTQKTSNFSKTRGQWPDDVLVGIESEIKIFPKEYSPSDLETSCSYGGHQVRACIKENSKILMGFQNKYPRAIGYDIINSPESNYYAYEFRTIGGLKRKDVEESVREFSNWVEPIYQNFINKNIERELMDGSDSMRRYFVCEVGDIESLVKFSGKLVLTDKYCFDTEGKAQLAIYNQATFSGNPDNVSTIIKKLMKNEGNFIKSTYANRKALAIFDADKWKSLQSEAQNWENSSFHYFAEKLNSKNLNIESLNSRQKLFIYQLLSSFKHHDQYTKEHKYYNERVEYLNILGNNYLKGFYPFLPKQADHYWISSSDLTNKIIALLDTDDLSLPYTVNSFDAPTRKHIITAKQYIENLKHIIGHPFKGGCKNSESTIDCIIYTLMKTCGQKNDIGVVIPGQNCDQVCNENACQRAALFPGSFFPFTDKKIVIEVRGLVNTVLPQKKDTGTIKVEDEIQARYVDIFEKFFKALES